MRLGEPISGSPVGRPPDCVPLTYVRGFPVSSGEAQVLLVHRQRPSMYKDLSVPDPHGVVSKLTRGNFHIKEQNMLVISKLLIDLTMLSCIALVLLWDNLV